MNERRIRALQARTIANGCTEAEAETAQRLLARTADRQIEDRADRVRAIVESHDGKVANRCGNTITVEIPAHVSPGLSALWGGGGFVPIFREQRFECGSPAQVWYVLDVDLRPRTAAVYGDDRPPNLFNSGINNGARP